MKPICKANQTIEKLLGPQIEDPAKTYRTANHSLAVKCEDGTLLFHTLTGMLLLMEPDEDEQMNRTFLLRNWFLVPDTFDEQKQTKDLRALLQTIQVKPNQITGFTILTTTDCNARCFYCYELGRKRTNMDEETARDVAAYIIRVANGEQVKIQWFGGEPLTNRRAIEIICEKLRESGVGFESSMVTNGYELDAKTAACARQDWNLKSIQVTLDGMEETYRRTKAYVDRPQSPLTVVLDHIDSALQEGIEVSIRLNIDANNASEMEQLIELLHCRFGGRSNLTVYCALLRAFTGKISAFASEQAAAEKVLELFQKLERYGFTKHKPIRTELKTSACMADNDSHEVIVPDGRIGKCEHYSETELVGSIYSSQKDRKQIQAWKEPVGTRKSCKNCPLYPRCYQLVKCDWTTVDCSESSRILHHAQLERQLLDAYENYKQEKQSEKRA